MKVDHPIVEILHSRNPRLSERAGHLIREAVSVLPFTVSTFPTGTSHGPEHTRSVERIGRILLSNEFLSELTDSELYFFALSCHYHDLAMAGSEADDATPENRDQVRRDHAIRVGDIIKERWEELGFESPREAEILSEVCRGHRPIKGPHGHATWDDIQRLEIFNIGESIRLRLVCALIYAVDELHIGGDRAPERVQEWRQIRNEESRRHWRRHQAIQGPASLRNGLLGYSVSVVTSGFEEDLRKNVFVKALCAVRDLRTQAAAEGISSTLPEIVIQWNRHALYNLTLSIAAADLIPRTREELKAAVLQLLSDQTDARTNLEGLCIEQGSNKEEISAGVVRCIDEAITRRILVSDGSKMNRFILSAEEEISRRLFKTTREADELDRLFIGQYHARWGDRLFRSGYGRAYMTGSVIPSVSKSYAVDLASHPAASPTRGLLESTPTAARLVMEYRPEPSNLVRLTLIELATFTGATFDAFADPDILLDRGRRLAYRSLAHALAKKMVETVRFLEELALVGGLAPEQVFSMQVASDAEREAIAVNDETDQNPITLSLKQELPKAGIRTSLFPYLVLASQRANVKVQLAASPDHQFSITSTSEELAKWGDVKPAFLEVLPTQSVALGHTSFQASIALDQSNNTLRIYLKRFDRGSPEQEPIRIRLELPKPVANRMMSGKLSLSFRWNHLKIADLNTIQVASRLEREGLLTLQILEQTTGNLIADEKRLPLSSPLAAVLPDWATPQVLEFLLSAGTPLPMPLFIKGERLVELAQSPKDEWTRVLGEFIESVTADSLEITSLVLDFADSEGNIWDEEFLGCILGRMLPNPVLKPEGKLSQDEFDQIAKSGNEDIVITSFFVEDMFTIADLIREWAGNLPGPFPLDLGSETPSHPTVRTAFSMAFLTAKDRIWHKEWPVRIGLRPVNQLEAYQQELQYWRASGDLRRAELIEERLEEFNRSQPDQRSEDHKITDQHLL